MSNHDDDLLEMALEISKALADAKLVQADDMPDVIRKTLGALREFNRVQASGDSQGIVGASHASTKGMRRVEDGPVVPVAESVKDDHIVCLEDGKKLRMLKRYLKAQFDMSPDEYRAKWGLPHDYPMTCPDLAEKRSGYAKKSGLGTSTSKSKTAE